MKKAASAPQLPTCSGVWSGQARVTAAMKAAANTRRPTSGVGGERNSHQSSIVFHQVPETGLLPAAAIHATSRDRKSTRLNSSHLGISYAVFCLKKKNI